MMKIEDLKVRLDDEDDDIMLIKGSEGWETPIFEQLSGKGCLEFFPTREQIVKAYAGRVKLHNSILEALEPYIVETSYENDGGYLVIMFLISEEGVIKLKEVCKN